ncbi:LysR family transcriptional regulator [Affinibrenneria salicis]|uniref:LysR family transcriptional regulator n=1 Tax=Affinibrenneria salicis TaxID=2590031 RepID=A0A5J5G6N2_9GAMM|nr:LysR family transcriptional regulator [Affinibrenneria salicis]KAA9002704.1 LysR family transcriptional regulator [Affinibrenneria salicis]KAA9003009.1 LysR family transcriptional regulator [Affinibrenneria salicis]
MELRYLRYFIAVASARHFTRAAENLGISQPPLSQQIQKLEREIGTPLFRRLTRGVEMTAAGEVLYQDASQILQLIDTAVDRARSIARGESGNLNVGFSCSASFHPAVLKLLHAYRQRYPHVTLRPQEENMPVLMSGLHNQSLDVAFVRLPCSASREFNSEILVEESMQLVIPAGHPLQRKQSIHLSELQQEPLIIFPREVSPGLYDMIMLSCYEAGYEPIMSQQAPQMTSAIGMVSAGFGITIIPRSLHFIQPGNLTYHDIENNQLTTQIALIWRKHEHSAVIMNMIHMMRNMLKSEE